MHTYTHPEVGDSAKVCTLTPSRRLNARPRPPTTGEAAIDSRIDEACSREHRGKVIQIFLKYYTKFCFEPCDRGPRARAKCHFQVSWTWMYILCNVGTLCRMCIIGSGITTGSWRALQSPWFIGDQGTHDPAMGAPCKAGHASCVPGYTINHAELPRSALLTSKVFFSSF
jgi:hypothetical protein